MSSLESLKKTIDTIKDLKSIVRTMKALSATSIRQYEKAVESLADYYRTVGLGLQVVLERGEPVVTPRTKDKDTSLGAVVFGSDHGLCGRFNEEITAFAKTELNKRHTPTEKGGVVAVGGRAEGHLQAMGQPVEDALPVPGSAAAITTTVQRILMKVETWRRKRALETVLLFYNARLPGKTLYAPQMVQLLPVDFKKFSGIGKKSWSSRSLPTFTMDRDALLAALIRQYLFVSIFRACAESLASEHASRLVSMQAAERNIGERLLELNAEFHKQRQESITEELLDVVAGFEILAGKGEGE